MKNIFILIVLLLSFANAEAVDSLKEIRKNVATELNSIVGDLKQDFKVSDDDLVSDKEAAQNLKNAAVALKNNSSKSETNPTVLLHGKSAMVDCNEKTEELRWKDGKWSCGSPEYKTDCRPSSGEDRVEDANGNYKCTQSGTYLNEPAGWGVCNNAKGERETQVACMYENSKNASQKYQVSSGCSNSIQRYKEACGTNGDNSSCKCPDGLSYDYNNGRPKCMPGSFIKHVSTKRDVSEASSTTIKLEDNTINFSSKGADTKSCMQDDSTMTFVLDKARLESVSLEFFFKRAGWIYINGKILYGFAGGRSIDKSLGSVFSRNGPWYMGGSGAPQVSFCGGYYYGSGYFNLKNNGSCVYTCDMKNKYHSYRVWGKKVHDIPISNFKNGINKIRFHRIWGNTGETDFARFTFNESLSSAKEIYVPQCKL